MRFWGHLQISVLGAIWKYPIWGPFANLRNGQWGTCANLRFRDHLQISVLGNRPKISMIFPKFLEAEIAETRMLDISDFITQTSAMMIGIMF